MKYFFKLLKRHLSKNNLFISTFSDLAVLLVFSCFVFSVWHWFALIQIGLKNGLPRVTDYPLWHQSRFWNPDLAPVGLTPRYQTNYFPATDLTHGVQFFGTIGFGTKIPSSSYLGTNLSPVISLFSINIEVIMDPEKSSLLDTKVVNNSTTWWLAPTFK